jgi:class 3 adenylate cyclase
MPDKDQVTEREKLEKAIAAQESLRGTLDDATVDATISALRQRLAELETDAQPEQRKQVTVLFMDVVNSTSIVRDLDPEDSLEILSTALKRMSDPVKVHGGRITRFGGDGFLAVFGLPRALENDPERAVRAGLGILSGAGDYARELEQTRGISGFDVRVGINTGLAIIGGGSEGEDTLTGSAIHLAARLESAAKPGTLLISHQTYQHIRGVFDLRPLEAIEARGFPEPVPVYQVLRAKPRSFRTRRRGVEGIETQMVGREAELKTLTDAYFMVVENHEG